MIIDDLGTEVVNQFTLSCLYHVINTRLNLQKPTVISTNLTSQELRRAYYSAAIRGRDYLDWFEITFTGQERGRRFDSYLETMQLLRREPPGPDTAMSRYLDDIEALYGQKEGAPLPDSLRKAARQNRKNKQKNQK